MGSVGFLGDYVLRMCVEEDQFAFHDIPYPNHSISSTTFLTPHPASHIFYQITP